MTTRESRAISLDATMAPPQRSSVPLTARIFRDRYTDAIVVLVLVGSVQARLTDNDERAHPRDRTAAEQLVRTFLADLGVRGHVVWDVKL